MIIRIVKMTFREDKISEFREIFDSSKELIRGMPGCSHLELLNDTGSPGIFFTYSCWNEEKDLDNYRNSELFAKVWTKTKMLFAAKPEAWSTSQLSKL
ncbi:MAG: putative quinol monooxygenase [Bacteroidia bacterium]